MTPPIMRIMKAQQYSHRPVVLAVAGVAVLATVTLACAGSGLAGALVPVPARKPDSIQSPAVIDVALPATKDSPSQNSGSVPVPPVKPSRGNDALSARDVEDMASMAATLGLIEPAGYAPDAVQKDLAPVPARKPNFSEPDVAMLLKFDETPKPKAKPLAKSAEAMSERDSELYRRIFAAQAQGDWDKADENLRKVSDLRLRGHVLYQRFMHPSYKASFNELHAWMDMYSDHPNADRVYKLAALRKPASFDGKLKSAKNQIGVGAGVLTVLSSAGDSYSPTKSRNKGQDREIAQLVKQVRADISRGAPTKALRRMSSDPAAKVMDNVEYDQLRAQIAHAYLLLGKPKDAQTLATASARRSGEKAPMAGWAAGLAAWQQKDYKSAAKFFEQTGRSPYSSSWLKSAGAYWASRAHMRSGDMKQVSVWLKEAATHPRTFYGMIATRALGWDFDFDWSTPDFSKGDFNRLVSIPAASRAMALVQAGQNHLAEAELLQINTKQNPELRDAILAYTQQVNLPSLAMRIASATAKPDGGLYDAALYPLLPWVPEGGYNIDRALIHAIIRQESKFNTAAESGSGAAGLMQIMPITASHVVGSLHFKDSAGKTRLKDPQTNLGIGQKYVNELLSYKDIDNELLSLAIAYNAGPGNLRKWKKELAHIDDPLLFIEMIPMAETRNYVERVLANYWIYRMRLDQPLPSLDAVAEGKWASYTPMDDNGAGVRLATTLKSFRVADAR